MILARTLWFLSLSACCCDPSDPSDPAATAEARFANAFLDDLAQGRNQAAFDKMNFIGPPPVGFDATRLGQRADRLGLSRVESTRWTRAHYLLNPPNPNRDPFEDRVLKCISNLNPPMKLEATVVANGRERPLSLVVRDTDGLHLAEVHLGSSPLVPSGLPTSYRAPEEPRPPGELLRRATIDRHAVGAQSYLRVRSPVAVPHEASVTMTGDCTTGDRWYRSVIVTHRAEPLSLSLALRPPAPDLCELRVRLSRGTIVETRTWCWTETEISEAPCKERPVPRRRSEHPVLVEQVARRVSDNGLLRLDYDLHANEQLPEPGAPERHHLEARVRCPGQDVRRVTRPANRESQPFGLFTKRSALYVERPSAFAVPCSVEIEWVAETPYERKTAMLFEGCLTDTEVTPGRCPYE